MNPQTSQVFFGVSFCIDLKFSNSSIWSRIFHGCAPYFLSRCSLAAWHAYTECPSPTDFRASPWRYWSNRKDLYSDVTRSWSIQAVNLDFQFSYCYLSLSFSNGILLPCYCSLILPVSPGISLLSIFAMSHCFMSLLTSLIVHCKMNCNGCFIISI